ncbi:MAG: hypothetical protein WCO30_02880, partial [bacterium]
YDIDGNVDKINSFIASTTSLSYYEGAQKEPGDYAYYVSAVNVTGESEVGPVLVNIGDYCKNGATNFPACDECGVNLSGVQESWVKDLYTGEFSCGICDSETEQVDLGSGICKIIGQPDLNWESTGCGTKFTWAPVEGAVAYRLYGYNYNGYDTGTDYDLAVEEIPSSAEKKDGLYLAITYFPQGTVPEGELMYSLVAVDADGNESAPAIVNDVVVVCACGYTDEAMCDGGHLDKSGCCVFCDVPGEIWSGEIPTLLDLPPVAGQTLPKCVVHPCNEDNLKNLTAEQKLRCVIPDPTDEECISICGQNPDDPICVNCPQPLDYYCFGNKPKGDYVKFGLNTKNGTNMQPSWEYSTSTLLGGCQWTCGKGPGGSGSVRRGNGCVLDLSRTQ